MMKIIHINHSDYIGGASRGCYRIHKALLKQGITSEIWVMKSILDEPEIKKVTNRESDFVYGIKNLISDNIIRLFERQSNNTTYKSLSIFKSNIVNIINSCDADIVNLHWVQREMLSISDLTRINKPIVWTLHDMWAFSGIHHFNFISDNKKTNDQKKRSKFRVSLDEIIFNHKLKKWNNLNMQFVAPSVWMSNCVNQSPLFKSKKTVVIPYPIDEELWKPLNRDKAKKHFQLPSNKKLILFGTAGDTNDPRKGFDLLIESLNKIQDTISNVELVIFGNKEPASLEIDLPIHNLGILTSDYQIAQLYNACDMIIIPSRQDNLPNIAIEAQSCGLPVATFNVGGLPDIVVHKETGYVSKCVSPSALSDAVLWLLNNESKLLSRKNISSLAIKKYSNDKVANMYADFFKEYINA